MKKFTHSRLLVFLFFSMFSISAMAQSPCDICNDPWGPVQNVTMTGQTVTGKPSSCTYTFNYSYRQRNCGGNIEIQIVSLSINPETTGMFCPLTNFMDCYNSRRSGIRSLVDFLGVPVTFSQEKSCYALFEVIPPKDFIDCFLSPGETVDTWYGFIECDANSCCSVTYTPNGDGTVSYTQNISTPCNPGSGASVPAFVEWECKGQTFIIPVDPQPVNCESTCTSSSGTIFKQAEVTEILQENKFTVYPNPTNGEITLDYEVFETDQLEILVMNVKGQKVYEAIVQITNGSASLSFNTEEWGAGIYTIRIQGDDQLLDSQHIQVTD